MGRARPRRQLALRGKTWSLRFLLLLLLSASGAWLGHRSIASLDLRNAVISSSESEAGTAAKGEGGDLTPEDWRRWVSEHSSNPDAGLTFAERPKFPRLPGMGGCGISIQLLFRTRGGSSSERTAVPSTTKAFFKSSHVNMTHINAESHLREIKASYLDWILGTGVVPPCVGYRLGRRQVQTDDDTWAEVRWDIACAEKARKKHTPSEEKQPATGAPTAGDDRGEGTTGGGEEETFEGSVMRWKQGLQQLSKRQIFESARLFDWRDNRLSIWRIFSSAWSFWRDGDAPQEHQLEEQTSAVNNAIFIYLGGCMKSNHNYFGYRELGRNQNRNNSSSSGVNDLGQRYLAIDNDRCMIPEVHPRRTSSEGHYSVQKWENLVFETVCWVPHHRLPVLRVVGEAAAASAAAGTSAMSTVAATAGAEERLVSHRLRMVLADDVLSDELLGSEPEAFVEIDRRIDKLDAHVHKNCPKGGKF